jgi:hypothetical protein
VIDGQRSFLSANRASPIKLYADLTPFLLGEGSAAFAFFGIAKVLLHSFVLAPSFGVAFSPSHYAAKMDLAIFAIVLPRTAEFTRMVFPISSLVAGELLCMISPIVFSPSSVDLRAVFFTPSSVICFHLFAPSSPTSSITREDFLVAFAKVVALVVLTHALGVSFGPGAMVDAKVSAIPVSPLSCLLAESRFVSLIPGVLVCCSSGIAGHGRESIKFWQWGKQEWLVQKT